MVIPYDSFLIDPFLLFAAAWACALIAAKRHPAARARFMVLSGFAVLSVFWITSVSLYFDCEWTRWIWEMCGAESGRDWMINSGVFRFEFRDPPVLTHILSVLCFSTYPVWFWLGSKAAFRTHGLRVAAPLARRWRGHKGRVETWYVTLTDPVTGDGFWLHGEILSPASKRRSLTRDDRVMAHPKKIMTRPYPVMTHGWCVIFRRGEAPRLERYGPEPFDAGFPELSSASASFGGSVLKGRSGKYAWDLTWKDGSKPLYTFPRWAWETEFLPGAQIVVAPTMTLEGEIYDGDRVMNLRGARGAFGRISSRGHAESWVWLHADLGGSDVLEIVAARSRHGLLRRLGLLGFVALRFGGTVWPRCGLLAALKGFRIEVAPSGWKLSGTHEGLRIAVEVDLPREASITLDYEDPDGSVRRCTNSETASARITLDKRVTGAWERYGLWVLEGTAHAEIGETV